MRTLAKRLKCNATLPHTQLQILIYISSIFPCGIIYFTDTFLSLFPLTPSLSLSLSLVSPMIWVPNQLVGAPAGTDVTIDCHTEAHPK